MDTSIAVSTGVSYATDNNELEEDRAKSNATWLHLFLTRDHPGAAGRRFDVFRPSAPSPLGRRWRYSESRAGFQYLMFGLRVHF